MRNNHVGRFSPCSCEESEFRRYQSERAKDRQSLYVGETQLHQTEANNDAIKNVPALLEVVVGIQRDQFQHHLSCEDPSEYLRKQSQKTQVYEDLEEYLHFSFSFKVNYLTLFYQQEKIAK